MEEMQIVVILLSVIIVIHSVMIIALFSILIALLTRVKKIAAKVEVTANNFAQASEWLSPIKVFSAAVRAFRKSNK